MLKIIVITIPVRMIRGPLHNITHFVVNNFKVLSRWFITRFVSVATYTRTKLGTFNLVRVNWEYITAMQTRFSKMLFNHINSLMYPVEIVKGVNYA